MKGKDVILGLLLSKNRSGYEINEFFQSVFTHFYDGSFGMIYPTLRALEKEDKIKKKVIIQEGKPNKNEFNITKEGIVEFYQYLNSKVQKETRKSDFLTRLYFGEFLNDEDMFQIITEEIKQKEKLIRQLKHDHTNWKGKLSRYQQLSFDIGIKQYQSEITVLKNFLENNSQY